MLGQDYGEDIKREDTMKLGILSIEELDRMSAECKQEIDDIMANPRYEHIPSAIKRVERLQRMQTSYKQYIDRQFEYLKNREISDGTGKQQV